MPSAGNFGQCTFNITQNGGTVHHIGSGYKDNDNFP